MAMYSQCPHCQLVFEREHGYFTGAMMISYVLSIVAYGLIFVVLQGVFQTPLGWMLMLEMLLVYLPFVPFVFRYSRILWIYLDRTLNPDQ